ncbi:hypothetical protein HanXRQr2_Chr05g0204171 [Helianthus annuus]|uniref:Uncharacterized protein n=1 Tax=Helianthus annuus TaxID=4232 RepID=A0A9K3IXS6_HELAN|nr:hypothetical protein HanXRQr2_Chr05g0204171 [Helianthus annuus]
MCDDRFYYKIPMFCDKGVGRLPPVKFSYEITLQASSNRRVVLLTVLWCI